MSRVPAGSEVTRLVWDTSALLNIKEPNADGYSPGHSLYKDFCDGWLKGPYFNIYPAIAVFEIQASISRLHRDGRRMLRDFFILSEHSMVYPVDDALIGGCMGLLDAPGFSKLRGADLIIACIAKVEDAILVTMDKGFAAVASEIRLLDLNDSIESANYRSYFQPEGA